MLYYNILRYALYFVVYLKRHVQAGDNVPYKSGGVFDRGVSTELNGLVVHLTNRELEGNRVSGWM